MTGGTGSNWDGPDGQSPLNEHTGGYDSDIVVIKLDESGLYQWHTFFGEATDIDFGSSIDVDGNGNIFIAGNSNRSWDGPGNSSPLNAHAGGYSEWADGPAYYRDIFVLKLTD